MFLKKDWKQSLIKLLQVCAMGAFLCIFHMRNRRANDNIRIERFKKTNQQICNKMACVIILKCKVQRFRYMLDTRTHISIIITETNRNDK